MTHESATLLSAPGTRVLLVGSGSHAPEARVTDVPAVADTVADLAACLIEYAGLDPRNLTRLIDPADPRVFAEAIDTAARQASDVLVFYYVGHSLLNARNQLHLATRSTVDLTQGSALYQALPYSEVRELFSRSRARHTLVVLDCCFAGRADGWPGSYILSSTSRDEAAWAIPGERHTAFTGELICLLAHGDPAAPRLLAIEDVYRCLARSMREKGLPEPRRQAADRSGWPPVTVNAAYRPSEGHRLPPSADESEHSPYRGLKAFGVDDVAFFFGRKELTEILARRVADQIATGVPLLVIGPSGSGKSSVLRAGLIPALNTRPSVVLTPGVDPVGHLLRQVAGDATDVLRSELERDPTHLGNVVSPGMVIVVDQFEEVFAACEDETQRKIFIRALAGVCERRSAAVVIGLRADFFGHCTLYPELVDALRHPEVVSAMNQEQLREVIERPAEVAGLALDEGLADLLMEDLGISSDTAQGVALPLLSHALLATWQRRENGILTLGGYRATGGIAQALALAADQTLRSLSLPAQQLARRMLLRLVRLGNGSDYTRRRVLLSELIPKIGTPEHAEASDVLDQFARARLVTVDEEGAEIVHEALMRAWPQLRAWIEADRSDLLIRQQLAEDASKWERYQRQDEFLYTRAHLAAIQETRTRWQSDPARYPPLEDLLRDFLRESDEAVTRAKRRRHAFIGALAVLLLVVLVGTSAIISTANDAARQHGLVLARQLAAQSEAMDDIDPTVSRLLATAAWRIAEVPEARLSLLNAFIHPARGILTGHIGPVNAVAFSPDGRILASAGNDGTIRLWDPVGRKQIGKPLIGHTGRAASLAFSPGGSILASGGHDGQVRLWDPTTGKQIGQPLAAHTNTVEAVAFSPDGRILASADNDDGKVRLWDPTTGKQIGQPLTGGHTGPVTSLAFSPDGSILASAGEERDSNGYDVDGNGKVRLWDPTTGEQIGQPLAAHTNIIQAVAFSPDGRILASADDFGGKVWLWDPITGKQIGQPLKVHVDTVDAVAFSPDGHILATASGDTIRLWDPVARKQIGQPLTGHVGSVTSLAFSPDGRTLASPGYEGTSNDDGAVRLWDVTIHRPIGRAITGHDRSVHTVAFAPDDRTLASAGYEGDESGDGTIRLWDLATRKQIRQPFIVPGVIELAFSPDGRILAGTSEGDQGDEDDSYNDDGVIRLWDVATHKQIAPPLTGHTGIVLDVAFSPDGRVLASASAGDDRTIRLWDLATHKQIGQPLTGHTGPIWEVTFSPDGHLLASSADDGTIRLWDPATHKQIGRPFTAHIGPVSSVTFSPDGRILASGGYDSTILLWDVITRRPIGPPLTGHTSNVSMVTFSPDGSMLASFSRDGTVRLWDVTTHKQIAQPFLGAVEAVAFSPDSRALASADDDGMIRLWNIATPSDLFSAVCTLAGRSFTREEWSRYLPDEPYQQVCMAD